MKIRAAMVAVLAAVTLTTSGLGGAVAGATGFERGPDPTPATLEAPAGPYGVAKVAVANSATPGFGAATIYSPTDLTPGWPTTGTTFGGVAIVPGFTGTQAAVAWLGPRLASNGFVVITLDTNSPFDQPAARGAQLRAALTYLTTASPAKAQVDATRLAVMGHSMGGGGALEAAKADPALKATIGLMPWHSDKTWPEVVTASLVVGAERDTTAPVGSHAKPFYNGMTKAPEKVYLELNEAGHSLVPAVQTTIATHSIAWLKWFVDGDTRYSQFICPGPDFSQNGPGPVANYLDTCDV
jgi:dienelactone hydrolase